jgi:hypothetical protein
MQPRNLLPSSASHGSFPPTLRALRERIPRSCSRLEPPNPHGSVLECASPLCSLHASRFERGPCGLGTACSPSPRPSPLGRGRTAVCSCAPPDRSAWTKARTRGLPLPKGEGRGEGEGAVRTESWQRSVPTASISKDPCKEQSPLALWVSLRSVCPGKSARGLAHSKTWRFMGREQPSNALGTCVRPASLTVTGPFPGGGRFSLSPRERVRVRGEGDVRPGWPFPPSDFA